MSHADVRGVNFDAKMVQKPPNTMIHSDFSRMLFPPDNRLNNLVTLAQMLVDSVSDEDIGSVR